MKRICWIFISIQTTFFRNTYSIIDVLVHIDTNAAQLFRFEMRLKWRLFVTLWFPIWVVFGLLILNCLLERLLLTIRSCNIWLKMNFILYLVVIKYFRRCTIVKLWLHKVTIVLVYLFNVYWIVLYLALLINFLLNTWRSQRVYTWTFLPIWVITVY